MFKITQYKKDKKIFDLEIKLFGEVELDFFFEGQAGTEE